MLGSHECVALSINSHGKVCYDLCSKSRTYSSNYLFLFCGVVLGVLSGLAIILLRKRDPQVALLLL